MNILTIYSVWNIYYKLMFFFPNINSSVKLLTDDQMIKSQQQIMSFGRSIDGIFPPNRSLIYIIIGLKFEYSKKFNY